MSSFPLSNAVYNLSSFVSTSRLTRARLSNRLSIRRLSMLNCSFESSTNCLKFHSVSMDSLIWSITNISSFRAFIEAALQASLPFL